MPLLTRLPRPRVKSQVACLSPGAVPSAVLRQNGVPTFDLALSRKRFSPGAFQELVQATRQFRPDVIQAWGHTAQVISALLRGRCDWKPRLVWSIADTIPIAKDAGFIDRQKLKYAAKFSSRADRIVYTSESAASQHRRAGFPDGEHVAIPPGVDATRFKPDFAARKKLREQLTLPGEAFVIGMSAPFQPESDHATLIKAIGDLVKTNPNIAVVLAGHGVQKGNAPLMALVGGGAIATRVHLLGEWSDISALYNACDVVCSSALNDQSRMNVVMAMLCGVPVVATGIGAQGEVIGQHGVAIEPGSSAAFVKGITRVLQLTPEKRTHMAQGARKHALANYVYVRSLQKYLQLYYDLIGRQSLVTNDLPTPDIDPTVTAPPALPTEAEMNVAKRKPVSLVDLSDPESLESKVSERDLEELPKWRQEQEQERTKREAEVAAKVAASKSVGDVLQVFESQNPKADAHATPMTERARGVADDSEELLSQDLLEADAPAPPRISTAPAGARKQTAAAPTAPPKDDAAKQAALKAARMAALQPIAKAPKPATTVRPAPVEKSAAPVAAAPVAAPKPAPVDVDASPSMDMLAETDLMQAPLPPAAKKIDSGATQPLEKASAAAPAAAAVNVTAPALVPQPPVVDINSTQPLELLLPEDVLGTASPPLDATDLSNPPTIDLSQTQPLELPKLEGLEEVAVRAPAPSAAPRAKAPEPEQTLPSASTSAPQAVVAPAAAEQIKPADEFAGLSLMATGAWAVSPRTIAKAAEAGEEPAELNGPETLSLIASPSASVAAKADAPPEPTLKLAILSDPPVEPKRAANGE